MKRALAVMLVLAGCHASSATPPTAPRPAVVIEDVPEKPERKPTAAERETNAIAACGLEHVVADVAACPAATGYASFLDVHSATGRLNLPPIDAYESVKSGATPARLKRRFDRDEEAVVTAAIAYLCMTKDTVASRFPAAARAVVQYDVGRVYFACERFAEAAAWFHRAAQGPPDLPETPNAALLETSALAQLAHAREGCYELIKAWLPPNRERICDIERPYASRPCLLLGRINYDIDRMNMGW